MGRSKRAPELPSKLKAELGVNGKARSGTQKSSEERPTKRRRVEEKSVAGPGKGKTALEKLAEKQAPKVKAKKSDAARAPGGKLSREEEIEDQEIAWLEAQLGIGQSGSKWKKEMEEDGLDDLFADLDRLEADETLGAEDDDEEEAPSEEEVSSSRCSMAHAHSPKPSDDNDSRQEEGSELEDWTGNDEEEWSGFGEDVSPAKTVHNEDQAEQPESAPGRYVPPHLRKAAAGAPNEALHTTSKAEAPPSDPRLRRILLGHLNKLSSANMPVMLPQIEALYRSHPRAVVSSQLADLLLELVASRDALGETFLVVYAVLVAAVSRLTGKELGAMVVARAVEVYDGAEVGDLMGTSSSRPGPKERINVVAFLSELYKCQVLACTLIYDLIRSFVVAGLGEHEVEMLLKVVKTSGGQLRQDDPSALKQIIQLAQEKQKEKDAGSVSSRARFMIETLANLKNNKIKADNVSAADASVALKKFLANLSKQRSLSIPEPLRLTLADLRSSASKGKWWLVGAAWGGDPLAEAHMNGEPISVGKKAAVAAAADGEVWAKLARQQGMNTDVRKNIFVALMSSEDYVDACERLTQLALKEVQQREIVRVIVHCTGKEKAYNPFYTLVMQQIIARAPKTAHSYQITLQYVLWDLLRDMGESAVSGAERLAAGGDEISEGNVSPRRARNIARAYGWWLAKGTLGLTILKPVPFGMLQPASTDFLRHLFSALLLSTQSNSPLLTVSASDRRDTKAVHAAFEKVAGIGGSLARGIRHFLETELMTSEDETVQWAANVADDYVRLGG